MSSFSSMEPVSPVAGSHDPLVAQSTEKQESNHDIKDTSGVKRPLKPLSKRKLDSYNEGLRKRGVVYLSRVPPFMKPAKIKHLMEQHGIVTRVRSAIFTASRL